MHPSPYALHLNSSSTTTTTCPAPLLLRAQGPTYSVTVNGGECEILDDGSVECEEPFVELSETPFTCNLPYREAAELEVRAWRGGAGFESAVLLGTLRLPPVQCFTHSVHILGVGHSSGPVVTNPQNVHTQRCEGHLR